MSFTFLSVCSGIDAASVATEEMGWQCIGFSEIEPFPCAVLAHRWPHVPNLGDMKLYETWTFSVRFDALFGGPPCQGFSLAGLRGGMDDPRSQLTLTYVEIAAKYRPRWLVYENVPGLLSSGNGSDFASFLGALTGSRVHVPEGGWKNSGVVAGISSAYGVAWRVLDAQHFGVPQRRRRVFVVGYLGDWRRAAAVLFERESVRGDSAPRREAGKGVAGTLTKSAMDGGSPCGGDGREGLLIHELAPTLDVRAGRSGETTFHTSGGLIPEISPSVTSKWAKGSGGPSGDECQNLLAVSPPLTSNPYGDHESREGLLVPVTTHAPTCEGFDASEDGTGRGTPIVPVAFSCKDHGADAGEISPTLRSMGHDGSHANGGGQVAVAFAIQAGAIKENPEHGPDGVGVRGDDVAYTLEARSEVQAVAFAQNTRDELREMGVVGALSAQPGMKQTSYIRKDMAVRRLMPVECHRLQGFPDGHCKIPWRGRDAEDCPDGPQYKALGNSWAVPCFRWIAQRIAMVERMVA